MRACSSNLSIRLSLTLLAFLAFGISALRAEDVIVTACIDNSGTTNTCPPSCCVNLGTTTLSPSCSTATPAGIYPRNSRIGISASATWILTPTLGTSSGAYKVYVSKCAATGCPADIIVRVVATSGCTMYDTNGVPAPAGVYTAAFQLGASVNVWTPVCIISNTSPTPTITFSHASGGYSKWYMDEVRFETLGAIPATPATITQVTYGTPITIAGTGPATHHFVLVSSTNLAQPLSLWTSEGPDTTGTGSFTFSIPPGSQRARFFRVITQ